jgi:hypothetical protein
VFVNPLDLGDSFPQREPELSSPLVDVNVVRPRVPPGWRPGEPLRALHMDLSSTGGRTGSYAEGGKDFASCAGRGPQRE